MKRKNHLRLVEGQPGIIKAGPAIEASYGNPVAYPLAAPTVDGTLFTIDMALQQPTRVTRTLMDLTMQRFFADRVFTSAGGVTGGAVVYDELQANELYGTRDIKRVAPGDEFPIVIGERRVPKVAEVEKWGGKFFVTIEARDRNDVSVFTRNVRQLSNTIVRKINQRAVEVLDAAILEHGRIFTGVDWGAVITTGAGASNATEWPARDFGKAQAIADEEEMGITYTLWIMNPQEYFNLATIYGSTLSDLLSSLGLDIFVTNRVEPGTAYVIAEGQVGQMRIEQGLTTITWYEEETERFWTQSSVRPLWFVDNPFAILKAEGLAGT